MNMDLWVLILTLVALVALRLPVAFALICAGFAYLFVSGQDMGLATDQIMNRLLNSYVLLAIPMFILSANVMNASTISERMWTAANAVVGQARGGLGHVTVLVSMVFSSMSGSALAEASGVGMVAIRMMRRIGKYKAGLAVAITAAAATLAAIIPPSIPMVLYALNSGTSVGALFLAGIVPGLMIGAALMATIAIVARRMDLPASPVPTGGKRSALLGGLIPLTLPFVLLGGIWSGIFTPTEAAAVASFWAFALAFVVYRSLTLKRAWQVITISMLQSVAVMLLVAGALIVNYALTREGLDRAIVAMVAGSDLEPWVFLLIINLIFLLLGCIVDTGLMILVLVPLILPTVLALGIDPVHFGVVIIFNIMIGLVTPPFGLVLIVLCGLGKTSIPETLRYLWPFLLTLIACLLVITFVPDVVLFLPRALGM